MASSAKYRNFAALALKNPLAVDSVVTFVEDDHAYLVEREGRVPVSVTGVKSRVFEEGDFDAKLIVRKNLASWRANPASKYHAIARDNDDAACERLIAESWRDGTRLGTDLHRRAEAHLNGETDYDDGGRTAVVWPRLLTALSAIESAGAEAFRTELSVLWRDSRTGRAVCAGQLDVLFKLDDEYIIGDFKCTDKDLAEDALPFKAKRVSRGPMKGELCNEFNKYSLQLSMYCVMLEQQCGIRIADNNRMIIRAHPSLEEAEVVEMRCFDAQARQILDNLPSLFPDRAEELAAAAVGEAEPDSKRAKQ